MIAITCLPQISMLLCYHKILFAKYPAVSLPSLYLTFKSLLSVAGVSVVVRPVRQGRAACRLRGVCVMRGVGGNHLYRALIVQREEAPGAPPL